MHHHLVDELLSFSASLPIITGRSSLIIERNHSQYPYQNLAPRREHLLPVLTGIKLTPPFVSGTVRTYDAQTK